jgi:hypothetical protein
MDQSTTPNMRTIISTCSAFALVLCLVACGEDNDGTRDGAANTFEDTATAKPHPVQHDGVTHIEDPVDGTDSIAPPEHK